MERQPPEPPDFDVSKNNIDPGVQRLKTAFHATGSALKFVGRLGMDHWKKLSISATAIAGSIYVVQLVDEPVMDAVGWAQEQYDTCYGDPETPDEVVAQDRCQDRNEFLTVAGVVVALNTAVVGAGMVNWARRIAHS